MQQHLAKHIVGKVGAVAVLGLVLAPIWFVFRHIVAAQNVGNRHCFPYAFTFMNAAAFVFHGANKKDWIVTVSNGIALVGEGIYCGIYVRYSHGWRRIEAVFMLALQAAFVIVLLILQFVVFKHEKQHELRDNVIGIMGAATALMMYASTLDQIYRAHMVHNVDGMEMGFAYLGNAMIWTAYAIIPDFDRYSVIANGIGIGFAVYQAGLWLKFWNAPNLDGEGNDA